MQHILDIITFISAIAVDELPWCTQLCTRLKGYKKVVKYTKKNCRLKDMTNMPRRVVFIPYVYQLPYKSRYSI